MKIAFFGSPASALPSLTKLLEAGHNIELIVTQPDRPSGRGQKSDPSPVKKKAIELGFPVCQPSKIREDLTVLDKLKIIQPDLIVVVAYGQIIPSSIIYLPKHKSWNVHFSLLPKYRGASPVQWAILNGEKRTGISIFELNEKMDEGDILAQEEIPILPDENAAELETRMAEKGADLLVETMNHIGTLKLFKQDHSQATYAPKIKKEDGLIDWSKDSLSIDRHVRAFTPWPSAFTFFRGKRLKICKGKSKEEKTVPSSFPGEILAIQAKSLQVSCGKGSTFLINRLQQEGRKEMDAYAFSLGAHIEVGERFNLE